MSTDLTRNTLYLTLASVGQKLVAFVYFLFVARVMQPEQTGTYFLALSLAMIFSVIADVGITPVVIREMAKAPDQTQTIFRRALALKIPFLFLGYACTIGSAALLGYPQEVIVLTSVAGCSLVLDSMHLLFYGVLRGHQKLGMESLGMFFGQLTVALIGGFILWFHPSLFLLLFALVAGSFFNVVLSGSVLMRRFGTGMFRPVWDASYAKSLMGMAAPFALAAIFVKIYSYVDTVFLSKVLDTTAVGLYSIAYKFTYAFQFLPLAFTAALYPKFSWCLKQQSDELPHLFRRALWYMLLLATPLVLGLWLIADHAVLLVGESYRDAAPVLSVLIFVLIPIFLDFPIGSLLNAAGRQAVKTSLMGLTMVINVVLNAIFIPRYGALGASYAALISFLFLFFAGFFFVPKIIPSFPFRLFFWDVLKISVSGVVMVLTGIFLLPVVGWIVIIPLCGIVYLLALFITRSLTRGDLAKMKQLIRV